MDIAGKSIEILRRRIKENKQSYCSGLYFSAKWLVFSNIAKRGLHFIILPDKESAEYCAFDLYNTVSEDKVFFLPESGVSIERSNYKSSLSVQRTSAIEQIITYDSFSVIVSYPDAIEEFIPSVSAFLNKRINLKKGEEISFDKLISKLNDAEFEKVDFVSVPGQFSIRGSIIDIFSFSTNYPYRISFWGDEIEEIFVFDPNTQLSKESVNSAEIISDISDEENNTEVLSILPENSVIWLDSSDMYKDRVFFQNIYKYKQVYFDIPISETNCEKVTFNISPQPDFNKNFEILGADIKSKIENNYKVYIIGEKESQLNRLKSILSLNDGYCPEFISGKNFHSGFIDNENKVCIYTDHEIFERYHRVQIRRSVEKTEQLTLNDISSFNIGDYIVHIDHGVGVFGGLVRMYDEKGRPKEVVKLNYKDGDVVFVSVHALNKISRFRSKDGETPKISKLGSKSWIALKAGAKSKIKDIAKELIQLYAKRRASKGFSFSQDTYLQNELESSFIYEDTPDQEAAVRAVKRDMEEECPMDRLICGDVGFGKTEVAIRAAFKAITDGKQVAVLVPTTILTLQHYQTFLSRLKDFPCNLDYVSRLRTAKEVSIIKSRLKEGKIDILIGTHKILGAGFEFKDLGLLIIDEEQKFGVSAKEKLRQLSVGVDTLTLTATPIPRTLQFSLLGARDLSIINTPPPNRIPIQTEIMLFEEKEIKSIIEYELNRGGQVFFLHNKVGELSGIYEILSRIVPDAKICIAHGQMESNELENRILDFIRGDYDILLCTTIIENGLDIPNANTIIINQAQNIGLSDLHQLRGRVGRSNKKAFCYLIIPPMVTISDDSRRRLKAIEEFSDLGSGFNIAMQDLDIRGAGNLLGAEQSGFIMEMGYEAYQKILSEAMSELGVEVNSSKKKDNINLNVDCVVETDQPAYIPDEYINISAEKIRIYKQLDSMTSEKDIDRLGLELIDRFGKYPAEVNNLFNVLKIRNISSYLGFEKVIVKNGMLICFFIGNQMSSYFKSKTFETVMKNLSEMPEFTFKQNDSKLRIVAHQIDSLEKALGKLRKISEKL